METGTVKFFNKTKGFGFVKPDHGEKEIFIHKNELSEDIIENDRVEYEVEETKKGLNAIKVSKI